MYSELNISSVKKVLCRIQADRINAEQRGQNTIVCSLPQGFSVPSVRIFGNSSSTIDRSLPPTDPASHKYTERCAEDPALLPLYSHPPFVSLP